MLNKHIRRHCRTQHSDKVPVYMCPSCDNTYQTESNYETHFISKHIEKPKRKRQPKIPNAIYDEVPREKSASKKKMPPKQKSKKKKPSKQKQAKQPVADTDQNELDEDAIEGDPIPSDPIPGDPIPDDPIPDDAIPNDPKKDDRPDFEMVIVENNFDEN